MRVTQWKTSQNAAGNQVRDGKHDPCADARGIPYTALTAGAKYGSRRGNDPIARPNRPGNGQARDVGALAPTTQLAQIGFALSTGAEPGYNIPWEPHFEEPLHPTPYGANDSECFRPHFDYLLSVRIVHSRGAHAVSTRDWCSRPGKFSSSETEMHQLPPKPRRALNGKSGKRQSARRRFSANSMCVNGRRNVSGKPLATRRGNRRRLR
jgi:hypothetical protein